MRKKIFIYLISFVLLLPVFFINYRLTAFDTLPTDDYAAGILYMDGQFPAFEFTSPIAYRFLYHGFGFVFYKILPFIPLSKLEAGSDFYRLKALQALAFTAFFYHHLFLFTAGMMVYRQVKRSMILAIAVVGILFALSLFMYYYSIDSFFLFYAALVLFNLKNIPIYAMLLLFSIVVNEKISLLFAIYFLMMMLISPSLKVRKYLIISIVSFGAYLLMKEVLNFKGYEFQTDPNLFFERIAISLPFIFSFKGFYMNILPFAILTALAIYLQKNKIFLTKDIILHPVILCMPAIFFIIGMHVSSDYCIGRDAMHTLPLFIIPIATLLNQELNKSETSAEKLL